MSTATHTSTTIQQTRIEKLLDRCGREIKSGLLPSCGVAVGFEGEIVAQATYGDATGDTRYLHLLGNQAICGFDDVAAHQ